MHGGSAFFSVERPLEPGPAARQLRAANIVGFPGLVRKLGGDPRGILERNGVDPVAMRDPDQYIDCTAFVNTLEFCSSRFNDPLFGLLLAELQEPEIYGCVTTLARSAPRIREGLQCYIDYLPVAHSPEGQTEIAIDGATTELRWCAPSGFAISDQALYQGLLLELKIMQMLGRNVFRPDYVVLAADIRGKDVEAIENRLGCEVKTHTQMSPNGGRIGYAVAFPTRMLDWPVPGSNKLTFALLKGYLDRMKAAANASIVDRVEAYIRSEISSGECSVLRCAKRLGLSSRTLQWRLTESGFKFTDMLEEQRAEIAKSCLSERTYMLPEIAGLLGYSEQSSFSRAFKRWTGMTPQAYRAKHAAPGPNSGREQRQQQGRQSG